jgi:hypothetical protein
MSAGCCATSSLGSDPDTTRSCSWPALLDHGNFDERMLTGAVFLDVAKAFDAVWDKGLLSKLTVQNFLHDLVKTIPSYLHSRSFQTSFQSATPTRRSVRSGAAQSKRATRVVYRVTTFRRRFCGTPSVTNPPAR